MVLVVRTRGVFNVVVIKKGSIEGAITESLVFLFEGSEKGWEGGRLRTCFDVSQVPCLLVGCVDRVGLEGRGCADVYVAYL